jgi:YggT family protein
MHHRALPALSASVPCGYIFILNKLAHMQALIFIVNALFSLLVWAFMLRVLLPLCRADARNPLSQGVIKVTNPLVMPLRRVLPALGRVDGGSLAALLLVQLASTALIWLFLGRSLQPLPLLGAALLSLVISVLRFYLFALLIYALLSWVAPGTYSPAGSVLTSLCTPIIRPIQRVIPPIGGLDLSVVFAMIAIQAVLILIGA